MVQVGVFYGEIVNIMDRESFGISPTFWVYNGLYNNGLFSSHLIEIKWFNVRYVSSNIILDTDSWRPFDYGSMEYTIVTFLETSKIWNFWYFCSTFWSIYIKNYDCWELHGYEPQILYVYFGCGYELSCNLWHRFLMDWLLALIWKFWSIFARFIIRFYCRMLIRQCFMVVNGLEAANFSFSFLFNE